MSGATIGVKICAAICIGLALVITSTFAALYGGLYERASAFDELHAADNPPSTYDQCGGLTSIIQGAEFTSNWTLVYRFNMILYIIMSAMLGLGCLGLAFPPLIACVGCSICGTCAQTAAIITGGIFRFRREGAACALVDTTYEGEDSWETDGQTYKALFIAQCALSIPMGCFITIAL